MAGETVVVRALRRLRRRWQGLRDLTTSSPSRFAVLVFSSLILLFTALFSLPAAAADGQPTPLADALFTAVSTICVTGLSTVDMGTHWSPWGTSSSTSASTSARWGC
jgi:trk system potassium uptake protein TrkH